MEEKSNNEDLNSIFDSIISGNHGKWRPFSEYISMKTVNYARISSNNIAIINHIISIRSAYPNWRDAIKAAEEGDPPAFHRLYRDLCDAYYSSPEAVALVAELAESGPREPSPHFDATLLETVIANQAGKRRL